MVRITATFTLNGVPVAPSTVKFIFRLPAGAPQSTIEYEMGGGIVQSPSIGVYVVEISAAYPGQWLYRVASSGVHQGASESQFFVEDSKVV